MQTLRAFERLVYLLNTVLSLPLTYVRLGTSPTDERGFEAFDDFLGDNFGGWYIVGLFEAFVAKPKMSRLALAVVNAPPILST